VYAVEADDLNRDPGDALGNDLTNALLETDVGRQGVPLAIVAAASGDRADPQDSSLAPGTRGEAREAEAVVEVVPSQAAVPG
jgi:hypothetical protein